MQEFPPENSEFRSEQEEPTPMSSCLEAAALLRTIAEPRPIGDTVKAAINRAAKRVSAHLRQPMRPGRAEDIWRGEARVIRAEEIDAIRRAAEARTNREARHEITQLDARIARLEALLVQDAEFHRTEVDAVGTMARSAHRAVDRG